MQAILVLYSIFVFGCSRKSEFRCKHRALQQRLPGPSLCHSPQKSLHPFSKGIREPKFSSETSSSWTRAADPSPPKEVQKSLVTVPRLYSNLSCSPLELTEFLEPWWMSPTSNCWSLKDTNLTKGLNIQGLKRRITTIAIKRPDKGRNHFELP